MERLDNFGQGAEENPTVAQSQPTSRAVQQTAVVGPGGAPLSVPGAPPSANLGNSMNVGGLTGYDLMMENAGLLDALGILPPGVGGGGAGGGGLGAGSGRANGGSRYGSPSQPGPDPAAVWVEIIGVWGTAMVRRGGLATNSTRPVNSPSGNRPNRLRDRGLIRGSLRRETELDVLASIPGADATPTPPLYEGYGWEVWKTAKGEGKAVVNTVTGALSAIWNYDKTWQGLKYAAAHPIRTAQAAASAVAAKIESGSEGQGEVAGDILLLIAGPAAVAKAVSKAKAVAASARIARAAELAEGLTAGTIPEGLDLAEGLLAVGESAAPAAEGAGAAGGLAEEAGQLAEAAAPNAGKPLHIDIGGEGRYPNAVNVNPNNVTPEVHSVRSCTGHRPEAAFREWSGGGHLD